MAKSRAQRKAEAARRRKLQEEQGGTPVESDSEAQHDTQVPESADVLEAEIAIEKGAEAANRLTDEEAPAEDSPDADAGEDKITRRERRRQEREQAEKAKAQLERRAAKAPVQTKERGAIMSFFSSVVKELQKVQWPDRDTLVQASAVTIIFVAVAAAYLGALDAVFSKLVDVFIT